MAKQQIYNDKRLISLSDPSKYPDGRVAASSNCCCTQPCDCEFNPGLSSCFGNDRIPTTYIVEFENVASCPGEDCSWLNGIFCLDENGSQRHEWDDGTKNIFLGADLPQLNAENVNGSNLFCFRGIFYTPQCRLSGWFESFYSNTDICSYGYPGYAGIGKYYSSCHSCSPCENDPSGFDNYGRFAVITFDGFNVCGPDRAADCDEMSIANTVNDFNGTWTIPLLSSTSESCTYEIYARDGNMSDLFTPKGRCPVRITITVTYTTIRVETVIGIFLQRSFDETLNISSHHCGDIYSDSGGEGCGGTADIYHTDSTTGVSYTLYFTS